MRIFNLKSCDVHLGYMRYIPSALRAVKRKNWLAFQHRSSLLPVCSVIPMKIRPKQKQITIKVETNNKFRSMNIVIIPWQCWLASTVNSLKAALVKLNVYLKPSVILFIRNQQVYMFYNFHYDVD